MVIQSNQQVHKTLSDDLKKLGSKKVFNDTARKTFSAKINGAIYEFSHKQADPAFWSGVKHYGSGPSNRLRLPRSPVAETTSPVAVKPKTRRKSPSA